MISPPCHQTTPIEKKPHQYSQTIIYFQILCREEHTGRDKQLVSYFKMPKCHMFVCIKTHLPLLYIQNHWCYSIRDKGSVTVSITTKNKKVHTLDSGCKPLAMKLIGNELGHVAMDIDTEWLDDGNGIKITLTRHHASWHKLSLLIYDQKHKKTQKNRKKKLNNYEINLKKTTKQIVDTPEHLGQSRDGSHTKGQMFLCNEPADL